MILLLVCFFTDGILAKNIRANTGDVIFIGYDGSKIPSDNLIYVCSSWIYLEELDKFMRAKDQIGIDELITRECVFELKEGSMAKVIKRDYTYISNRRTAYLELRILDGEHKDKSMAILIHLACNLVEEKKPQKKPPQPQKLTKEELEAKKAAEEKKRAEENESKAAELLKHAKRWQAEGNIENAVVRLKDLLKRFPDSKSAPEAKKLLKEIEK